ncbi:NAD(P)H-dependent oxidoreductase [Jannaschia ovalis]|uniref:NAD(P)H-dependent oxidoreductase n=1 Tax=Jannaschia ovalis TaxID=3038773 RepID=A0ABY8LI59_9RHOB|nr:NAD(P)H-dependent oxidoreductase [Jannaschia sp. GRR-S6-38]WGH79798.1 NAD(P)H-dependent oxidoreductase [Jannaschia sp. GRR-S6-38]
MSPKRIVILDGHPAETSLSRAFAMAYAEAARGRGHVVRLHHLSEMRFDPDFGGGGYGNAKPLEPELEALLGDIEWAEHVVLAAPVWWGGLPARLKGLIDRAFLPGRTFDTRNTTAMGLPAPLLTGRTGRVFLTSDTPNWIYRLFYGSALMRQLTGQVLGFVGIRPARITHFAGATDAAPERITRWLRDVRRLGQAAA